MNIVKKPIPKKTFLSPEQKQEKIKRERVERQRKIEESRSEGFKQWMKDHPSAKPIVETVMNTLDNYPQEGKKYLIDYLRVQVSWFDFNSSDLNEDEKVIADMGAVISNLLREIHDCLAEEIGRESYKEFINKICKECDIAPPKSIRELNKEKLDKPI